jgi:DNA-binding transcriptional ArsR family regulator
VGEPPAAWFTFLGGIAEATRLRVVWLLRGGPLIVGEIAAGVGLPMANVSHHLQVLRRAGVLVAAKEGRHIHYALNPAVFSAGSQGRPAALTVEGLRLALPKD